MTDIITMSQAVFSIYVLYQYSKFKNEKKDFFLHSEVTYP